LLSPEYKDGCAPPRHVAPTSSSISHSGLATRKHHYTYITKATAMTQNVLHLDSGCDDALQRIAVILSSAMNVVVIMGAGVSTVANIPVCFHIQHHSIFSNCCRTFAQRMGCIRREMSSAMMLSGTLLTEPGSCQSPWSFASEPLKRSRLRRISSFVLYETGANFSGATPRTSTCLKLRWASIRTSTPKRTASLFTALFPTYGVSSAAMRSTGTNTRPLYTPQMTCLVRNAGCHAKREWTKVYGQPRSAASYQTSRYWMLTTAMEKQLRRSSTGTWRPGRTSFSSSEQVCVFLIQRS